MSLASSDLVSSFENLAFDILNKDQPLDGISESITDIISTLLQAGKFDALVTILEQILLRYQTNDYLFFLQSLCLFRTSRSDLSKACINQALVLDEMLGSGAQSENYKAFLDLVTNYEATEISGSCVADRECDLSGEASRNGDGVPVYSEAALAEIKYIQTPEQTAQRNAAIEDGIPPMLLLTMPSAGSQYIVYHLASCFNVSRFNTAVNSYPHSVFSPGLLKDFSRGGAIDTSHAHFNDANFNALVDAGLSKMVLSVRDPRQAFLSFFYLLEEAAWFDRRRHYISLPPEYESLPIEERIDWNIEHIYHQHWANWAMQWVEQAADPVSGLKIKIFTFEEFKRDPKKYFLGIGEFFGLDRKRLDRESLREYKYSNGSMIKGNNNSWRTMLTPKQIEKIQDMTPDALLNACGWLR